MSNPPSSESAISGFEWKSIGKPPSLLERIRDPETLLSPQGHIESPPSAPPDPTNQTSPRRGKPSLLRRIDIHTAPTPAGSSDMHPPAARMNGHTPMQDIFKIPLIHPTTAPASTQNPKPAMSSFCISLPVVTLAPASSTTATPMQLDSPNAAATVEAASTNLLRPPPTTNGTPSSSSVGQNVVASSLSASDLYKHISAAGVERMELDEVKHARKHVLDAQQEYLRRYEETRSAAVREKEHMDKLVSAVLDALAKTEKVQERQEKRWAEENERLEKLLKAKEEEERRLREEEAQRIEAQKEAEAAAAAAAVAAQKAKEEAEAAAKAAREKREAEEAEARARAVEEKAREEALATQKAEEERQEQERQERSRLEAEAQAKVEERLRLEAEAKAKEEQAVRARELRDRIKAKEKAQVEERARELYERLEEKADIERVRAEAKAIAQEAASGRARRLEEDRVQRTSNTPTHTAEPLDEGQGALAKLVSSAFATSRAPSQISNDGQPQRPPPTIAAPSTSSTGRIAPEAHAFPCDGPTTSVHLRPTPVLNSFHPPAQTAGPFDSSGDGRTTVMRGAEMNPDVKPPVDLAPQSTSPLNRPIQLVAESIKTSPSMSSMRQPRSLWPPSSSVGAQAASSGSASRMDVATLGTAHVQTRKSSGQNGTVRPVSKNSGTFIKPEPVDALIPPTPMLTQGPQPPPRPQQQSHPDVTANPAPPPPPPSKAQPPPPAISAPPAEILNSRAPPRAVLPSLSTPVQPAARRPPPASLPQKPTVLPAPISTRDEVAAPKVTVPTLQSFNSRNGDRSGRPPANINSDVNRPPSSINAERSVATGVSPPVRVSEPQHAAPPAVPAHWRAEHDDDAWVITPGGGSDRHSQRYRSPTPDRRYDHYSPEPERYSYPPRPPRYEPPSPPGRKRRMDSQRDNAPYKRARYDERSRSPHSRRAYSGSTSDRAYTPPSPRDRYRPPPRPISPMARRSPIPSFSPEPPISPYQSSIGSRRSVDWSLPDTRPYSPELRQAGTSSSARQLPPPARPLSPARRPFIPSSNPPPPPPLAGRMSRPSQIAPDDHQRAQSGKKAARPRIDTDPSSASVWRGKPVPVPVPTSTRDGPPVLLTRMSSGGGPRHGPPGSEQGRARRGNVRGRGRGGGNTARGGRGGYRDLESRITG